MTKRAVYLNSFARKGGFRSQFLRQSAFYNYHCRRGLMTSLRNLITSLIRKTQILKLIHCFSQKPHQTVQIPNRTASSNFDLHPPLKYAEKRLAATERFTEKPMVTFLVLNTVIYSYIPDIHDIL